MADDIVAPADIAGWLRTQLSTSYKAPHTNSCSALSGDGHDWRPDLCDCAWPNAIRAILDLHPIHRYSVPGLDDPELIWCDTCHDYGEHQAVRWPCPTVLALAQPFAGEPGFDPSWLLET